MSKRVNYIKIDVEKLYETLKLRGIGQANFSRELGRSKSYIYSLRNYDEIDENMEALICRILELPKGTFVKVQESECFMKPEENTGEGVDRVVRVLENMYSLLNGLNDEITALRERQDKIYAKIQANTIQLEKLKDSVGEALKTDYDKAVDFLKEKLAGGRIDGTELLRMSDAAGIKRGDLMKAKNELNIKITTVGYGKNGKAVWSMR